MTTAVGLTVSKTDRSRRSVHNETKTIMR